MIYFDNAATTYPKPEEVYQALDKAQRSLSFNAGRGSYKESRDCLEILDELRKEIGDTIDEDKDNVILLSSATEALNLIINGLEYEDGMNIYITPFEHNAIVRPLYNIKSKYRINICVLPFDKNTWEPNVEKIKNMFALDKPSMVFCSQISNVVGLAIEYEKIFELSKSFGSINILDAAQGYAIYPIKKQNLDYVVFAGHKSLYGPFGIGGFVKISSTELRVVKSGGTGSDTLNHYMPESGYSRYESGSPNVPAAYGTLYGIKWVKNHNLYLKELNLTRYLIEKLKQNHKIHIYIPDNFERVIGIVSISIDGYSADDVGDILYSEFGICVRTGFHCSPLIHEFIGSYKQGGTVRISVGAFNNERDVDTLIESLDSL